MFDDMLFTEVTELLYKSCPSVILAEVLLVVTTPAKACSTSSVRASVIAMKIRGSAIVNKRAPKIMSKLFNCVPTYVGAT